MLYSVGRLRSFSGLTLFPHLHLCKLLLRAGCNLSFIVVHAQRYFCFDWRRRHTVQILLSRSSSRNRISRRNWFPRAARNVRWNIPERIVLKRLLPVVRDSSHVVHGNVAARMTASSIRGCETILKDRAESDMDRVLMEDTSARKGSEKNWINLSDLRE